MKALAIVGYIAVAHAFGAPWNCATQPGPFSIFVNELHYLQNGPTFDPTVEILAVRAAQIDYQNIDAVVLDAQGNVLGRRSVGTTCAGTLNMGTNPAVDIFVCQNWNANIRAVAGGLALVNNVGTIDTADDHLIQYVGAGTTATFMGVQPCLIPADQAQHLQSDPGASVQLINTATWDSTLNMVDIYGFDWQGLLQQSFGFLNGGTSPWGAFTEAFQPGTLHATGPDPAKKLCDQRGVTGK